jgi:hypothetical protein
MMFQAPPRRVPKLCPVGHSLPALTQGTCPRVAGFAILLALMIPALAHADEVQVSRSAYNLQVEQRGQGSMVVVFESGFGQGASVWKAVVDAIRSVVLLKAL